jgi:hypothetical protein
MGRTFLVLIAVLLGACSPVPSPSTVETLPPSLLPTSSAHPSAALTTESIASLLVTHPVSWKAVSGPAEVKGGTVPLFYLSNAPLRAPACPTLRPGGVFAGCLEPLDALPLNGVLVTVMPSLRLPEFVPPRVGVQAASEPCRSIDGTFSMTSVVENVVVEACLRGPDVVGAETEIRALVSSLHPAP